MADMTARAFARRELLRARTQLDGYAAHVQRVCGTHEGKGLADVDAALAQIRALTVLLADLTEQLRNRL